ncbi:MAG: Stp1/IreP family PP2C-type Ser/Thr phosphatase [Planctomycetota bacterium]
MTDIGKEREKNEDALLIEPEVGLFLVCDGMGGHKGGELASKIVTEDLSVIIENRLHARKKPCDRTIKSIIKKSIIEQNKHLQMESDSETGYKDMGATLVLALLREGRAYIANLGDSRIYLLRKGKLKQLTRDHSVISELIDMGHISPEEAENHSAQGLITHYVGMPEQAEPHVRSIGLKKSDRLLLCTDGLTDMVNDQSISELLKNEAEPQKVCEELVKAANSAGGHDNITAVIIDWL